MKTLRRLCVTIAGLLFLVGCEDISEEFSNSENSESLTSSNTTISQEQLTPIILGEKLENPFSVENMQKALNSLLEEPNELEGARVSKRNTEMLTISPTDWYICFKVDSTQFNILISDTTLALSQVPLDYEIIQHGDYLEEFQNSEIKTLYTVVKPGYINPNGIDFEILDEIFIPENSEYYSEEEEESVGEKRSLSANSFNDNFVSLLLEKAFKNTDNERFLANTQLEKRQLIQGKKTSYYPEGKISYQTPNGYEPVRGVKIVMWRWFTRIEAVTDKNGYFRSTTKLNKILIGNNVQYYMNMSGKNGDQKWHLDANLFGVVCFWINEYNLGNCSPDYVEFKFDTNHKAWRQCLVNNSIYDYINNIRDEGLTLPPNNLRVAVGENIKEAHSAPLFTQYFSAKIESLACLVDLALGTAVGVGVLPNITLLKPDIVIHCPNNKDEFLNVYSTVWHELSHGSHLQAMINNKGKTFASNYWTTIVIQEGSNGLASKSIYGEKGDKNWEYIALAEGWAYYREWKLAKKHLKFNPITETGEGSLFYDTDPADRTGYLEYRYAGLMKEISNIVSDEIFEKTISNSVSIDEFKLKLFNIYPSRKITLNKKFNYYENLE